MFICKECQCIYEVKPKFCDCGNDVFEEIKDVKEEFSNEYPMEAETHNPFKRQNNTDIVAVAFFILCVIFSVLSLIFMGNSKEEVSIPKNIKEDVQIAIKDIEEIWDSTPPQIQEANEHQAQEEENKKQETVVSKIISKVNNTPKTVTKPKTEAAPKTKTSSVKTNEVSTKNTVQLKPVIKEKQDTTSKEASNITTKSTSLTELKVYKNGLRNLLFSKIDFTQIEGDGIGAVTFKIENTGKLYDKNFVQKSGNIMLDDAIFYSLNTTSVYKAPPSLYKGETLTFKVKFAGGQYEVSLN